MTNIRKSDTSQVADKVRFKHELRARIGEFANPCHDEVGRFCETHGTVHDWSKWQEAQKSAVEFLSESERGRYWLNKEGKFVQSHAKTGYHGAIIPPEMVTSMGPDYRTFAKTTKAIRILVSPVESTIHVWGPPNGAQREAIEGLIRQTVILQGDRDDGQSYHIQYLNGSAEGKLASGVALLGKFIKGEIGPGSQRYEFKGEEVRSGEPDLGERFILPTWESQPYLEQYETVPREEARAEFETMIEEFANPYHDPKNGRFTEGPAGKLAKAGQEPGGATITRTGENVTSGYVVSLKAYSKPVSTDEFRANSVKITKKWLAASIKSGALDDPSNVLGVWHEGTPDNMVSLDVNRIIPHGSKNAESRAKKLGADNDQVAIYHIETDRVIPTGGTGGYKETS